MMEKIQNPSTLWATRHIYVMHTTGPSALQMAYDTYDKKEYIKFLPTEFLFPSECGLCSEKPCSTEGSYTIIVEGSSWCGLDSSIISFFYCNYHYLLPIILVGILSYIFCMYSN